MNAPLSLTTIATIWMSLHCLTAGMAIATEKPNLTPETASTIALTTSSEATPRNKEDKPYQPPDNGGPGSSQGSGTR